MDVSFSRLHKYETCGAQFQYHYVQGLRPDATAANLLFGKAVDKAASEFIKGHALGEAGDPVPIFEREWARLLANHIVTFGATQSPQAFHDTGVELFRQFPGFWENTGLTALIGPGGQPMVQQKLTVQLPSGIRLRGFLDVAALTADGEVAIIDLKTALKAAPEAILLIGEQLTDYQILVEANKERLGIESVAKVGFIDLLKRNVSKDGQGAGPQIVGPCLTSPRSETIVRERREKIAYLVTQIHKGVFFRSPRMAFNTPCDMCDFKNLCLHGSMEGLSKPAQAQKKIV